jgi:hypothetical protein
MTAEFLAPDVRPLTSFFGNSAEFSQLKPIKEIILMEMLLKNVNQKQNAQLPLKSRHLKAEYDQIYTYGLILEKTGSSFQ